MIDVAANRKTNVDDLKNPGDFIFTEDGSGNICGLIAVCPCGCAQEAGVRFECSSYPEDKYPGVPKWKWDGSLDKPTLTPSIQKTIGCRWHGYLTNGVFVKC